MADYDLEDPFVAKDVESETKIEVNMEPNTEPIKIKETLIVNEKSKSKCECSEKKINKHHILINFEKNVTPINCIITATNHKDKVIAINQEIRLLQNRFYFIPVNTDINSDDYDNIKMFSDMSDNIDIRYIKNGIASIMALKHNILIKDKQRLCVVW